MCLSVVWLVYGVMLLVMFIIGCCMLLLPQHLVLPHELAQVVEGVPDEDVPAEVLGRRGGRAWCFRHAVGACCQQVSRPDGQGIGLRSLRLQARILPRSLFPLAHIKILVSQPWGPPLGAARLEGSGLLRSREGHGLEAGNGRGPPRSARAFRRCREALAEQREPHRSKHNV